MSDREPVTAQERHEALEQSVGHLARLEVLDRDQYQCRRCGVGGENRLQLHHIVYRSHQGGDTRDNLVTLCWKCHAALHNHEFTMAVADTPLGLQFFFSRPFLR